MKISEMINELLEYQKQYGDLDVASDMSMFSHVPIKLRFVESGTVNNPSYIAIVIDGEALTNYAKEVVNERYK